MQLGLHGRRALVRGSNKEIGYAIFGELLSEDGAVVLCARNAGEVDAAAEQLGELVTGRLAAGEVPLGRFGTTDEVSGVVAFLASDRASNVTGAVVGIAGSMER